MTDTANSSFKKKTIVTQAPPPPRIVRGSSWIPTPKPTAVLDHLPPFYPAAMKAQTDLVICKAVKKFPVQTDVLELCKYVVTELRPHFAQALRNEVLRKDEALDRMRELIRSLLVYNCKSDTRRDELEREVERSEEWLSLAETIVGSADAKDSPRANTENRREVAVRSPLDQSLTHKQRTANRAGRPNSNSPSTLDQSAILKLGDEMVVECGPLSAKDTDTSAPAIELLRKLGFGREQQEWPSSYFGPVLPAVSEQLKRAHQILTTRGFVFAEDPLNPLGDGKSWVLKCKPPIELPDGSDPARLAKSFLQKEGVTVPTRPVLDGKDLLIPLGESWRDSVVVSDDCEPVRDDEAATSSFGYSHKEHLAERMGKWDGELRRISLAARAKRQYNEKSARTAFPYFTLWKAIDESNLTTVRRCELFEQACQTFGSQEGRFQLIGELTGMSRHTAYDIFKERPSRKKRSLKK